MAMEMSTEGTNWESTDSFLLWRVFVWEDNIGVGKAAAVEWPDSQNCLCLKVSDLAVVHPPGLTSRTCRSRFREIELTPSKKSCSASRRQIQLLKKLTFQTLHTPVVSPSAN